MECDPKDAVTVIIPTLNESGLVVLLIDQLQAQYPGIRILVMDDGSTDCTAAEVHALPQGAEIFVDRSNEAQHGLTASVLHGIALTKTDYFLVMDGDLQHPSSAVSRLLQCLASGADLVIAQRLPYSEKQALHRIVATRVATQCARALLRTKGMDIRDPMSGFFAGRTAVIRPIIERNRSRFAETGYKVLFDLLKCIDCQIDIRTVDYQFCVSRGRGRSKLALRHAYVFLTSLFK